MEIIEQSEVDYEWTSILCGNGIVTFLLSDSREVSVKAGLGPGFWKRIRDQLELEVPELSKEQLDRIPIPYGIAFHYGEANG